MDYLWTPWRYAYVTAAAEGAKGCIFCELPRLGDDKKARIVYRGQHCFIILNTFPYTPGHSMIVPYAHIDELRLLAPDAAQEMMALSQKMENVMRRLYKPDGVNLGMNIGKAAGRAKTSPIQLTFCIDPEHVLFIETDSLMTGELSYGYIVARTPVCPACQ